VPRSSVIATGPLVLPAALAWGLLSALTVTAKSTRDALFCAYFPTAELPKTMVAGAALSAVFALATARISRRHGPARVLPVLLILNALAFLVEHAVLDSAPRAIALLIYLHVSGVTGLMLSGFWSVVNERFDPHALRLSISRIGLGGTLGGFVGGVSAERIAAWTGARHTLLELAGFSLLAALSIKNLGSPETVTAPVSDAQPVHFASGYLRQIALFVGLTTLASSVVDFAFKARAMERYESPEALMQFFAVFYTGTSLVSFIVQATITPRLLDRAGLGVGLGTHPAVLAVAGLLSLALPGLGSQALLRGADGALVVSLFRSSYEPLYTPMAAEKKRAAKSMIDVLVNRCGDALGSLLAWGLVLLVPAAAAFWASAVVVVVALAALVIAAELRKGYIAELAESLRSGAVVLDESGVQDHTTRLTLSRTMSDLNRERLLAEIQRQRDLGMMGGPPPSPPPTSSLPPPAANMAAPLTTSDVPPGSPPSSDPSSPGGHAAPGHALAMAGPRKAQLVADLLSNEAGRLRTALAAADPSLTAFVIPLIARGDVGAQAMNVLGDFGSRIVGQLADALLDAGGLSPTVRRRLVRVIANSRSAWAATALASALEDPDFDVRRQVVRGLEEIWDSGVGTPIGRTPALAVAARELESREGPPDPERVEHVLRLLGLVFDREAFRLARSALGHADAKLHGTALEYLDNVLPATIKTALFALLPSQPSLRSQRVEHELIDELRRTLG
jgi:ATP:ADP antiporter, AAA family